MQTEEIAGKSVVITFQDVTLAQALRDLEKAYLAHALTEANGNKAAAARIAGVGESAFKKKLARFDVRAVFSLA